jgi:hypothetical protein
MAKTAQDPWLLNPDGSPDPFANNVDWGANYADLKDPDVVEPDNQEQFIDPALDAHEQLDPEVIRTPPAEAEPIVEPPPPPEVDQPETMTLDDGTELTIEKEKGQWKGTVSSSTGGNPQVYWGKNLKELIFNTLKAQANATKKIREQNAKLKFRDTPKPAQPQSATPKISQARKLTADETFEYKTLLESDPDAAQDFLLMKTRGVTMDQLLSLSQEGARKGEYASNQLTAESVNKSFLANNPDYYPDDNWHNYTMIVKWLAKYKLGQSVDSVNDSVLTKLITAGAYTAENLEEAFRDLIDDDLLVKAPVKKLPKTPPPVEVLTEPAPAPRPDPRIVSQVTRPRASLGIGRNDITPIVSPETPKAPSVEDLDNMTDEQHNALWAAIQRHRAQSRRSN